jgi:serine/threonine protein kinase
MYNRDSLPKNICPSYQKQNSEPLTRNDYTTESNKQSSLNSNEIQIGDYFVLLQNEKLGKGNFGVVYKGRYFGISTDRLVSNQYVAIKEISLTSEKIKNAPGVVESECNIAKTLINKYHPNIVSYYDIVKQNDKLYIIMELCDSGSLKGLMDSLNQKNEYNKNDPQYVKKYIHMKEEYIQFYFSQLARAVEFLHENEIIHRDIKLDNILLTNQKSVLKIVDFGLAKNMTDFDLTGTICGSPQYMAPEIINRSKYTNKIELWSIGMVLFQLVYNFHALDDCKNWPQLKANLISKKEIQIPPIASPCNIQINTKISYGCIDLLTKLLRKNCNDRLTMEEFFCHDYVQKCHMAYARKIFENSVVKTVKSHRSRSTSLIKKREKRETGSRKTISDNNIPVQSPENSSKLIKTDALGESSNIETQTEVITKEETKNSIIKTQDIEPKSSPINIADNINNSIKSYINTSPDKLLFSDSEISIIMKDFVIIEQYPPIKGSNVINMSNQRNNKKSFNSYDEIFDLEMSK